MRREVHAIRDVFGVELHARLGAMVIQLGEWNDRPTGCLIPWPAGPEGPSRGRR